MAAFAQEANRTARIIKLGWDEPDPDLMLSQIETMESYDFDGVIFGAMADTPSGRVSFQTNIWSTRAFTEQELAHALETLGKIPFKRFTDNFLRVCVTPGNVDWFDPKFDSVIQNIRLAGKLVKAAHARGIFLDDEMYQGQIFAYRGVNPELDKSFEETCEQARRCGKRFIEALQSEVDSPVIVLTFAYSAVNMPAREDFDREARAWSEPFRDAFHRGDRERLNRETEWLLETAQKAKAPSLEKILKQLKSAPADTGPKFFEDAIQQIQEEYKRIQYERYSFGLLPSFLDGMVEGATGETVFVDGYELAYGYRTNAEYARARADILASVNRSSLPEDCAKRLRVGYGVYMDQGWPTVGWHPEDPEKNRLSPLEYEFCLNRALAHSNSYVWSYSEQPNWWTGDKFSKAYADALKQSRKPHDPHWTTTRSIPADPTPTPAPAPAESSSNEINQAFAPFLESYDFIQDLSDEWGFHPDPGKTGHPQELVNTNYNKWKKIRISRLWDDQGFRIESGYGWYRMDITIPENLKDRDLYLAFGAVDEAAVVYVNGNIACRFGMPSKTWDQPFMVHITPYIQFSQSNALAVRVENAVGNGGLWRGAKLLARKQ